MKKILFTFIALVAFAVASHAQGTLKFETTSHDFGEISEGPVATYTFKVTNTGTAPVIIAKAQASCGCTTPDWDKDPIMPGASSSIKVGYNTSGRPGVFKKTITITSNAENGTVILNISGNVKAKAGSTK